jgi:hypothetical protein
MWEIRADPCALRGKCSSLFGHDLNDGCVGRAINIAPDVSATCECVDVLVVIKTVQFVFELKKSIQMFAVNPQSVCELVQKRIRDPSLRKVMAQVVLAVDVPHINLTVKSESDRTAN